MARFLSLNGGQWDKDIQVQDLFIAIQQRYVVAKDMTDLILQASKKAIPDSINKPLIHEEYLEMYEHTTFSSRGSSEDSDRHLKDWAMNMFKTGAEKQFPNMTIAINTIEAMRILMKSRQQSGFKLTLVMFWDQVQAACMLTSGAVVKIGRKNIMCFNGAGWTAA